VVRLLPRMALVAASVLVVVGLVLLTGELHEEPMRMAKQVGRARSAQPAAAPELAMERPARSEGEAGRDVLSVADAAKGARGPEAREAMKSAPPMTRPGSKDEKVARAAAPAVAKTGPGIRAPKPADAAGPVPPGKAAGTMAEAAPKGMPAPARPKGAAPSAPAPGEAVADTEERLDRERKAGAVRVHG
jgi:hypothetical protein